MNTPSQKLASKIVERLVSENFLDVDVGKKLLPKLTDGKLRAEDWRLAIETSNKKEAKS